MSPDVNPLDASPGEVEVLLAELKDAQRRIAELEGLVAGLGPRLAESEMANGGLRYRLRCIEEAARAVLADSAASRVALRAALEEGEA